MSTDDASANKKTYSYCPGPRAIFTLIENAENIRHVNQEVNKSVADFLGGSLTNFSLS